MRQQQRQQEQSILASQQQRGVYQRHYLHEPWHES